MNQQIKRKARKLTYLLRHNPKEFGITLDNGGWGDVSSILNSLKLSMEQLESIVSNDNKNRFSFNEDKTKIRANQGHSIKVDLGLTPITPPEILYHGTVEKYIPFIKESGLKKMSRHHVHLSEDLETAEQVASRRETNSVILKILASKMHKDGFVFYKSDNGVWLTDSVPSKYIIF